MPAGPQTEPILLSVAPSPEKTQEAPVVEQALPRIEINPEPPVPSQLQPHEKEQDSAFIEKEIPKTKIPPESPVHPKELTASQVKNPGPKTRPSVDQAGIEISNGNGINQMARKVGEYLKEVGMKVARLTNAANFKYDKTRIFYQEGYEEEARTIGEQLPVGREDMRCVKKLDRPHIKVKVLMGRDLIPYKKVFFDKGRTPRERQAMASAVSARKEE